MHGCGEWEFYCRGIFDGGDAVIGGESRRVWLLEGVLGG